MISRAVPTSQGYDAASDIGQTGAESWTVLADPEGNEFCVVRPKATLIQSS
jgi:hypothetical protein